MKEKYNIVISERQAVPRSKRMREKGQSASSAAVLDMTRYFTMYVSSIFMWYLQLTGQGLLEVMVRHIRVYSTFHF